MFTFNNSTAIGTGHTANLSLYNSMIDICNFGNNIYLHIGFSSTSLDIKILERNILNNTLTILKSISLSITNGNGNLTIKKLQDGKFWIFMNGRYWILNVSLDGLYTCTLENPEGILISPNITSGNILNLTNNEVGTNNYILLGQNYFRNISISSTGIITYNTPEIPNPLGSMYGCKLTDGRVFLKNDTSYIILDSATLSILKDITLFGITLAGPVRNNYENLNGSNYLYTIGSSVQYGCSIYINSDNSITLSTQLLLSSGSYYYTQCFGFINDTSLFTQTIIGSTSIERGYSIDIGIGTISSSSLLNYLIQGGNAHNASILKISDNFYIISGYQRTHIANIGNGYNLTGNMISGNQIYQDSFSKIQISYSESKPANTNITYWYSLDDGVNWIQYTVASGTQILIGTSSFQLKIKVILTTTDSAVTPSVNSISVNISQ